MSKKVRTLMTLEDVGSHGKYFTENVYFKIFVCIICSVLIWLALASQLSFMVPKVVALVVTGVLTIPVAMFVFSKLILSERELVKVYRNQYGRDKNGELIDGVESVLSRSCSKYSDIYGIDKHNVCYHSNGYKSMFVSITRGTTIGLTLAEVEDYMSCLCKFESDLMCVNATCNVKSYEVEMPVKNVTLLGKQNLYVNNIDIDGLKENMQLKNKYLDAFIKLNSREMRNVYVVYCKQYQYSKLHKIVESSLDNLNHKAMTNVHIMDKSEIDEFGDVFFDISNFDCINYGDKIDETILEVLEEKL